MSLINDALKRAHEVDRQRRATPPAPTLRPVDAGGAGAKSASKWLVLALVFVALGLSAWSFSRWASNPPPPREQPASTPKSFAAPPPPVQPVVDPQAASSNTPTLESRIDPPVLASSTPAAIPDQEPLTDPVPNEVLSTPPAVSPPTGDALAADLALPPPAVEPVKFQLQSIIYRVRKPTVVINGRLLEEGDTIEGATISKIEPQQVTLSVMETNLILEMPGY